MQLLIPGLVHTHAYAAKYFYDNTGRLLNRFKVLVLGVISGTAILYIICGHQEKEVNSSCSN
jgi:hypothetical protein